LNSPHWRLPYLHWLRIATYGFVFIALLLLARRVDAHQGGLFTPSDLWAHWKWNFALVVSLFVSTWLYAYGVSALRSQQVGVPGWQVAAFSIGIAALVVAFLSPLEALSGALFSAHMGQHLLLTVVAAPLLVLGVSQLPLLERISPGWRQQFKRWQGNSVLRRSGYVLTLPMVAWIFHAGMIWVWHLPGLYQPALHNEFTHTLEHACLLGSGLVYWWAVHQSGRNTQALALLAMAIQVGLLGSLIAFSPTPWYPDYQITVAPWGLTPLQDQHLAGLLLWLTAGGVYLGAMASLLADWLRVRQRARLGERLSNP